MALQVLIPETIHPRGLELLRAGAETIFLPDRPGETLDDYLPTADAIVVRSTRLDAERLARASRLRVIGKHGVGVENIDVVRARELGIEVISTPGANAEAVAEHAVMLMLMVARQVALANRMLREGDFLAARSASLANDLFGQTLGVIGLGKIGSRLATICRQALRMPVVAYGPRLDPTRAGALGVEALASAEDVFRRADVISLHAPLTTATRGLINATALATMKPTAIFINCARGGLVDETSLVEALREGKLAGAGLDVFELEPPSLDNPLLYFENVVTTPHIAGNSRQGYQRIGEMVAEDVLGILRGEKPRHPV